MNAVTATQDVNSSRVSAPLSFKVTNSLRVNDDQTLNVADTYIIAQGRPPRNPPLASNASFQSVADGGKPPYTYSSSMPNVAVVDTNGKVVAAGIGSARITVTDSDRNTASYNITFQGKARLVKQGPRVSWSPNADDRNRPEYYALKRSEMNSFWLQYEDELAGQSLPAYLGWDASTSYWSGDNFLGSNEAWYIDFSAPRPDFGGHKIDGGTKLPTFTKVSW